MWQYMSEPALRTLKIVSDSFQFLLHMIFTHSLTHSFSHPITNSLTPPLTNEWSDLGLRVYPALEPINGPLHDKGALAPRYTGYLGMHAREIAESRSEESFLVGGQSSSG